jgi:hypothetical protein
MNYNSVFHQFQEIIFNIFIAVSWSLILLTSTGIFNEYPDAFNKVAFYVKIYICLFLIWRFNPIRQFFVKTPIIFTSLDRKIAFSAGLIILSTTIIKEYLVFIKPKATAESKNLIT